MWLNPVADWVQEINATDTEIQLIGGSLYNFSGMKNVGGSNFTLSASRPGWQPDRRRPRGPRRGGGRCPAAHRAVADAAREVGLEF